jgi:hypothetical protein
VARELWAGKIFLILAGLGRRGRNPPRGHRSERRPPRLRWLAGNPQAIQFDDLSATRTSSQINRLSAPSPAVRGGSRGDTERQAEAPVPPRRITGFEARWDRRSACRDGIGGAVWTSACYDSFVENRTEPKTVGQWVRYIVVAVIALFLVWWMLRLYVL